MSLIEFKKRFSEIVKPDNAIELALSDAKLIINNYDVKDELKDVAILYLTAHMLTIKSGEAEQKVAKVKADSVEVAFDSGNNGDWLSLTSYGNILKTMIASDLSTNNKKIHKIGIFAV